MSFLLNSSIQKEFGTSLNTNDKVLQQTYILSILKLLNWFKYFLLILFNLRFDNSPKGNSLHIKKKHSCFTLFFKIYLTVGNKPYPESKKANLILYKYATSFYLLKLNA